MAGPQMTMVRYNPGQLTVGWTPDQPGGFTGYQVTLESNGTQQHWQTEQTQLRVDVTLSASDKNTVWVTVLVNGQPAGTSQKYDVIAAAPLVSLVQYDTTPALRLDWTAVAGDGVALYVATLVESGGPTNNETTGGLSVVFSQELSGQKQYSVSVRAMDATGVVLGPASNSYSPIVLAPGMSLVQYDTTPALRLDWTAVQGDGVASYVATLVESGGPTRNETTDSLSVVFSQALSDQKQYSVSVRAMDATGVVLGPPSTPVAPLTTRPSAPTVAYTGSALLIRWTADTSPSTTAYLAQLLEDDADQGSRAESAPPATFDQTLESGKVYKGRVRSTANKVGGPKVEGPWTAFATGPFAEDITFAFDALGRITSFAVASYNTRAYTPDLFGNITSVTTTSTAGAGENPS